jgi:hypothetical protein
MDRRKIILNQPIKNIGNYKIQVRPHSAVSAEILLTVLIESDEPVARVKTKDKESEAIIAGMEAALQEVEPQVTESQEPPEPEESTQEEHEAQSQGTEEPAQEEETVEAAPEESEAVPEEEETAEKAVEEEEKSE